MTMFKQTSKLICGVFMIQSNQDMANVRKLALRMSYQEAIPLIRRANADRVTRPTKRRLSTLEVTADDVERAADPGLPSLLSVYVMRFFGFEIAADGSLVPAIQGRIIPRCTKREKLVSSSAHMMFSFTAIFSLSQHKSRSPCVAISWRRCHEPRFR